MSRNCNQSDWDEKLADATRNAEIVVTCIVGAVLVLIIGCAWALLVRR